MATPGSAHTIGRSKRCQNCVHYENGEPARKRYKELRFRDLQRAAAAILDGKQPPAGLTGVRLADDERPRLRHKRAAEKVTDIKALPSMSAMDKMMRKMGLSYELGDNLMRAGRLGICLIGVPAGDFVEYRYLCDKWTGRFTPDDADEGDELPEEAKDRLGYD